VVVAGGRSSAAAEIMSRPSRDLFPRNRELALNV
jgi:hypothetical protein